MRQREAERIARRAVPGDGAIQVTALSAGPLQDTFRVERDGRAFSMRLARAPAGQTRRRALPQAAWLLRVLQRAAEHALAPPLVYGDARRGIIVHQWVEGHAWSPAAARRPRNIARLAALLRRLHGLAVPSPARACTPAMWVRHYSAALAERNRGLERGARPGLPRAVAPALAASAARRLRRLAALPAVGGVICHSDLHRLNLLARRAPRGALLLLDWEYAHVSEPLWDLAGWSANNDFGDLPRRRLLAAYLGRAPNAAERQRLQLLEWLYDYVCLLWGQVHFDSRRSDAAPLALRAALLQSRLSASD